MSHLWQIVKMDTWAFAMKKTLRWIAFEVIDPIFSFIMLWYMRFVVVVGSALIIAYFIKIIFGFDY